MNPANPYDRRRGPRDRGAMLAGGVGGDWTSFGPARVDTPLTIRELEAMVYSAVQRGREAGSRDCDEAQQQGRREAWEEGYQVGHEDGHVALLNDIDSTYGDRMRAAQRDALVLLARHEEDPRKVTKSDLATMLHETQAVLMEFLISHGHGF